MNAVKKDTAERSGLTETEVKASREKNGSNQLSKQQGNGFFRRFLSNLNDPVIRVLIGALALKLIVLFQSNDWVETIGIAIAVLLASVISTTSEYNSAKAFERLSEQSANVNCRVKRDGIIKEIPIAQIVVGDIVLLSAGEQIPADGRILSGELRVDQSAMTGEGIDVKKFPTPQFQASPDESAALFRGCTVTMGSGEMEVLTVGDATFLGSISKEIQLEQRESPLKLRLAKLAKQISILGYITAVLVALVYLFNSFVLDSGMQKELIILKLSTPSYLLSQMLNAFTLALTVIVVAVPEGLPMMIAVILSSNIHKMVKGQVLVRKAVGVESAGSMNLLFTDKTGTLTEGKMKISSIILPNSQKSSAHAFFKKGGIHAHLLSLCFRYCNDATLGIDAKGNRCVLGGNATGRALLESIRTYPVPNGIGVTSYLPFDSARKYAAVTLKGKENITLLLGAPERLLPFCADTLLENEKTAPMPISLIRREINEQTEHGGRVLAVAISRERLSATAHTNGVCGTLTYLGAVSLTDPVRKEAPHSVAVLQDAGIQVVMVTGDSPDTAKKIALHCGILNSENDTILTGDELSKMSDAKLSELLPRLAVVARALPSDKSRLVRIAEEMGKVTGMTGDGINDAPALRRADIGFAMGSGTQVAKDAGDIIILDNNLASIVRAVLYGRGIFKSIRKFISLQLTMNFCAVGVTMICPFLGIDSPVTVVQMLWINLIMDTLGGLAFAGEPALPDCMKEPPKKREEPILNRYMINQIAFLGSFTVALCLFFLKSPTITSQFRSSPNQIYLLTAFFALFIFSSVFNCFNARNDRLKPLVGIAKNPIFLLIMFAILVIQIAFVYLGGSVLRTTPLTARELFLTMCLSLSVFPVDWIRKALWRLRGKKQGY